MLRRFFQAGVLNSVINRVAVKNRTELATRDTAWLILRPVTYLLGKIPDRDDAPSNYRFNCMTEARGSEVMRSAS